VPLLVAFVLALCVPFAQLKSNGDRIECCCPDESTCTCPDHQDVGTQQTMQTCHKQVHEGIAVQHAAFVTPVIPVTVAPATAAAAEPLALASPHAEPPPQRPAAPS
jgi:hypothetical protein